MASAYPWYDSIWLSQLREATRRLADRRPDVLPEFRAALDVFRVRPDFQVQELVRPLDDAVLDALVEAASQVPMTELSVHEMATFGRYTMHDHPLITEVQTSVVDLVSELAGEPLEPCYNFLSLYTEKGACPVHMDTPEAKWTLDLCLRQSSRWPIHISQPVPWPEDYEYPGDDWRERIIGDPGLQFESYVLEPGNAVFFGGSSQWHYRDPHPGTGTEHCDLVFLHFFPRGRWDLIRPDRWAALFDAPELEGLGYPRQAIEPAQAGSEGRPGADG